GGGEHRRGSLRHGGGDPRGRRAGPGAGGREGRGRMLVNYRVVRIEWCDCDPAGIIYYPRYFTIFDACTSALIERALGMRKIDYLKAYAFSGHPRVNADSRFTLPPRFGEEVTIEPAVPALRRSSFDVRHRLYKDGALAA